MKKIFLLVVLGLQLQIVCYAQHYEANWSSIDSRPVPQWFTDAKFGIFIHWGVFSVPAWGPLPSDGASIYQCYAEWYWWRLNNPEDKAHSFFRNYHHKVYGADFRYQDFVKDFRAEMFDPGEWAKVFKSSGARYVVLTSKHHEGFTLWPSEQAWNWNAVDVGPHRDLAGDLIKAVRAEGLKMGYYYSLYEWFNPLYRRDVNRYVTEHMTPQMKDLVIRYKPDIFWTDGEWDHPSEIWKSTDFLAWLYNESPVKETVVVNDRWGKETRGKHGGIYTTEYDLVHDENATNKKIEHPWEECRGIGSSFGYNRNENLEDYSSSTELIKILIDKVARGGNLLLNIGPTADGRIPVIMQQRLNDMGEWLKVNGEAIYETKPWSSAPQQKNESVYYTTKGKDLFVIFTKYPDSFTVPGINRPSQVELLGYKEKVSFSGNKISAPKMTPATMPCQHAWVFKLTGAAK
ncbi:MAG TPA: alpha-L-fucosidase [Chryseosolibacter sp.]